jgi:hypothetical protein
VGADAVIVGARGLLDTEPTIVLPWKDFDSGGAELLVVEVVRAGIQWDRGFVKSKVKNTSADEHVSTMLPRITKTSKPDMKDKI